jgi:hypothetical protein
VKADKCGLRIMPAVSCGLIPREKLGQTLIRLIVPYSWVLRYILGKSALFDTHYLDRIRK